MIAFIEPFRVKPVCRLDEHDGQVLRAEQTDEPVHVAHDVAGVRHVSGAVLVEVLALRVDDKERYPPVLEVVDHGADASTARPGHPSSPTKRAVCDNAGDKEASQMVDRERVLHILAEHREELRAMGVDQLSLFGSVARDEAGEGSDVDILVQFDPGARIGMFEFLEVQEALASLLGAEVDLATPASLHPRLRDAILQEAILAA